MLLLTFGFSDCLFLNFCVLSSFFSSSKFEFNSSLYLFDNLGWRDVFLAFRHSTGPLVRQSCCLLPFALKVPRTYLPKEMHHDLDSVLFVSL